MADVTIRVRDNGPFLVEGPFKLVDAEGNEFSIDPNKPAVAICRCGKTERGPFCDGAHKACGFESCERAGG